MVFHWCLSDSKSPQVSRTLLSILAALNNAIVWMVSTRPPTSKSSSSFNNLLVTVTKAPVTNDIIVTFMFHSFFQFPSKVQVFILLFIFFQFYSVVSWDSKVDNLANSLFLLLIIIKSGLLGEIFIMIIYLSTSLCMLLISYLITISLILYIYIYIYIREKRERERERERESVCVCVWWKKI